MLSSLGVSGVGLCTIGGVSVCVLVGALMWVTLGIFLLNLLRISIRILPILLLPRSKVRLNKQFNKVN